jgi:predicted metal-dependent HD superfamily phosphohydrolase
MESALMQSWHCLIGRAGLAGASILGEQLVARYAQSRRCYHGVAHLAHIVGLLEQMQADDHLLLAAWFHDAVYRAGDPGNERKSAALAQSSLERFGYPRASAEFVAEAVLATAAHQPDPRFDALLDADMSILGASREDYRRYRDGVRREYRLVPESMFRKGRLAFVEALLRRPAIFQTTWCSSRFESAARANLQAEYRELIAAGALRCA